MNKKPRKPGKPHVRPKSSTALTPRRISSSAIVPVQPSVGSIQLPPTMGMAVLGMSGSNFTPAQRAALMTPFNDDEMELLPSGEVYSPAAFIRNRFNQVFGPGNWGLMDEPPAIKGGTVVVRWTLMVNKIPVAAAFGEAKYIESNPRHSWGKALESAKSNAVMRCAKDLGVGIKQFWNRRWQFRYRLAHGVFVKVKDRHGNIDAQWRHLNSPPLTGEVGLDERSPNQDRYQPPTAARRAAGVTYQPRTDADEDAAEAAELKASAAKSLVVYGDGPVDNVARRQMFAAMKTHSRSEVDVKAFLKGEWGYTSTKQIQKSQFKTVLDWIRAPWDVAPSAQREPGEDG